jgi:hypothetical protein
VNKLLHADSRVRAFRLAWLGSDGACGYGDIERERREGDVSGPPDLVPGPGEPCPLLGRQL